MHETVLWAYGVLYICTDFARSSSNVRCEHPPEQENIPILFISIDLFCRSATLIPAHCRPSQQPAESISVGPSLSNRTLWRNQTLTGHIDLTEPCSPPTPMSAWFSLCSSLWGLNPDSYRPRTGGSLETAGNLLICQKPKVNTAAAEDVLETDSDK